MRKLNSNHSEFVVFRFAHVLNLTVVGHYTINIPTLHHHLTPGEDTPYDGIYGEAPPERGTFFQASGI